MKLSSGSILNSKAPDGMQKHSLIDSILLAALIRPLGTKLQWRITAQWPPYSRLCIWPPMSFIFDHTITRLQKAKIY